MNVRMSRLANGMRLVTHRMDHVETVTLGVWVEAGARSESQSQNGLSHLLEHMAFKGTQRRAARDIAEEIESVGGELNASTGLESTTYYARVLKNDVPRALDIISDILLNPQFAAEELEREKHVILQEIAGAQDCPDDVVFDLVQETAFPGQALGRPILGTAEHVRAFQPDDLRAYLGEKYSADGMVLSAAGNVDHDQVAALAEELFAGLGRSPALAPEAARYCGGVRNGPQRFEQSHLVVAFEGPGYKGSEIYAAQLLSSLLGGGMSSRLFQEVREERGLCYAIYSFCWGVADSGLFGVHAATGPEQMPELIEVLGQELSRAAVTVPSEEELGRAKAQAKAGLLMSLESTGARAEQLARQVLVFGRPLDITEVVEKVEHVTPEDVRSMAERILGESVPSVAGVGPHAPLVGNDALAHAFGRVATAAAE